MRDPLSREARGGRLATVGVGSTPETPRPVSGWQGCQVRRCTPRGVHLCRVGDYLRFRVVQAVITVSTPLTLTVRCSNGAPLPSPSCAAMNLVTSPA